MREGSTPAPILVEAGDWGVLAVVYAWLHVSNFGTDLTGRAIVGGVLLLLNVAMALGLAIVGWRRVLTRRTRAAS